MTGKRSRKAGVESGPVNPKGNAKSEVESPKSEEENNSAPDSYRDENPTSEIENKSDIENPKSEIKPMEVHHHPDVEKKGLKEYVLEGLMIFIAVMMGFFAESIRENLTNKEHVEQLSEQLIHDLKNDTLNLQKAAVFENELVKKNDALFFLLQKPIAKADMEKIQQLIINSYSLKVFHPSAGAIAAIKNELHIKQFANSKISEYITNYEAQTGILKTIEDIQENNFAKYIEPFLIGHFTPANIHAAFSGDTSSTVNGEMYAITQTDFNRLSVEIVLIKRFNDDLISHYKIIKDDAVDLMAYIKKEYHLEDE